MKDSMEIAAWFSVRLIQNFLPAGGDPHTELHRLWLLQLRPDQVHDSQSQGPPPPDKKIESIYSRAYAKERHQKTQHSSENLAREFPPFIASASIRSLERGNYAKLSTSTATTIIAASSATL
jgi:hypothetical protein